MKGDVRVAAVVVTYNRMMMLRQCLQKLEIQRGLATIFVVDNASTDGTRHMLSEEFARVMVVPLQANIGGAGGFHEGIKRAYHGGYDWIWVMDDDTLPEPDALEQLLKAAETIMPSPEVLSSVVHWTDGALHVMNVPQFRFQGIDPTTIIDTTGRGAVPIPSASFVSTMTSRRAVASYGLPITDYFIWADDVEYTARILRHEPGVWVLGSVAIHQTQSNYAPSRFAGGCYFFHLRNYIWILRFARIPIRTNEDDGYFGDAFQMTPRDGYTRLFARMLDHPNIDLRLDTRWEEVKAGVGSAHVIFSGPIEAYFDYCYGPLPYRSLEFRFTTYATEWMQPVATINYPDERPYTRVTEIKHITGQRHPHTVLITEFPQAEGAPYYPIPAPDTRALLKRYWDLAQDTPNVTFIGRLGSYRYYNMDQVVAQALRVADALFVNCQSVTTDRVGL